MGPDLASEGGRYGARFARQRHFAESCGDQEGWEVLGKSYPVWENFGRIRFLS